MRILMIIVIVWLLPGMVLGGSKAKPQAEPGAYDAEELYPCEGPADNADPEHQQGLDELQHALMKPDLLKRATELRAAVSNPSVPHREIRKMIRILCAARQNIGIPVTFGELDLSSEKLAALLKERRKLQKPASILFHK